MLKDSVHYDGIPAKAGHQLRAVIKAIVPLNVSVTSTGNTADQNEDVLATYSIPANTMGANGVQGFEIEAWGITAGNGDNKQVKLYFGAALIASGVITDNGKNWHARLYVWRTGLNTQIVVGELLHDLVDIAPVVTTATETETGAIVAKVTGQGTTGNTANEVVVKLFTVKAIEQKL